MRYLFLLLVIAFSAAQAPAQDAWKPAPGPLLTRWAKDVNPEHPLPEYPRPQMVRKEWLNLNGIWDLSLNSKRAASAVFDKRILVPFPVESALSGVGAKVDEDSMIRYRRTFELPKGWTGRHVLLHFGAVDWEAHVLVNGKDIGAHKGGYDPFTFDITPAIQYPGPQTIEVDVTDPTDTGWQPRGKQVLKPEGIFYTSSSGIWQTVWLEPVEARHIVSLKVIPDIDKGQVHINVDGAGGQGLRYTATVGSAPRIYAEGSAAVGRELVLDIPNPQLWSPTSPTLYSLRIQLTRKGSSVPIDQIRSYFGMRKISLGKDSKGTTRIFLNNKPQFMVGPLDQGFWPDGLYTAPTDVALKSDLDTLKGLGFNVVRKHVKVEPDRWYYWCDRMGMLVWQDMPSGFVTGAKEHDARDAAAKDEFENELKNMIDTHLNHPSIIMWVVFNEGWGQYDTERLTKWTKALDPSRLVDNATGWTDKRVGDVIDMHNYPGPGSPQPEPSRAAVLGEFGGLGLPLDGHMWKDKGWSYQGYKTREELTPALAQLLNNLRPLIGYPGLSAAIYTQTTDVETELNGLMPYDRSIIKADKIKIADTIGRLYEPPPTVKTIVPTSRNQGYVWKYTTTKPADMWTQAAFDDSAWDSGEGGFGTAGTPGAVIRTLWNTADIWLRRTIEISADAKIHSLNLLVHHDDDAEIYLDGEQISKLPGYTSSYVIVPADGLKTVSAGKHVLAIHCHQISGGQYIDAGIVDLIPESLPRGTSEKRPRKAKVTRRRR